MAAGAAPAGGHRRAGVRRSGRCGPAADGHPDEHDRYGGQPGLGRVRPRRAERHLPSRALPSAGTC